VSGRLSPSALGRVSKPKEKNIQDPVVAYARSLGCVAIKLSTLGRFGTSGWPDFELLHSGRTLFIEFKAPGGVCTPLQLERHAQLRAVGHTVTVVSDVATGKLVVEHFIQPRRTL
jgi:hypothetical protein